MTKVRKPNRTRTIQGAKDKQARDVSLVYVIGGQTEYVHPMTQDERCGGGRRVLRKRSPGGNY